MGGTAGGKWVNSEKNAGRLGEAGYLVGERNDGYGGCVTTHVGIPLKTKFGFVGYWSDSRRVGCT